MIYLAVWDLNRAISLDSNNQLAYVARGMQYAKLNMEAGDGS